MTFLRKGSFVGLLVAGLVAAGAGPAGAKCVSGICPDVRIETTVDGPDMAAPVSFDRPATKRLLYLTGATMNWSAGQAFAQRPSRRQLGPAYEIRYVSTVRRPGADTSRTYVVVQEVFPFAPDGAWTHTPAGQKLHASRHEVLRTEDIWWRSTLLTHVLVSHGVPRPDGRHVPGAAVAPPAVEVAPPAAEVLPRTDEDVAAGPDTAAPRTPGAPIGRLLMALGALAGLLVLGAIGARPRRAAA